MWIRFKRFLCGIFCVIVVIIYYLYLNDSVRGVVLLDYLFGILVIGEGEFFGYGIFLGEDLNRFKVNCFFIRLENVNWLISLLGVIKFWIWF